MKGLELAAGKLCVSASVANGLTANVYAGSGFNVNGDKDKIECPAVVCFVETREQLYPDTDNFRIEVASLVVQVQEKASQTDFTSSLERVTHGAFTRNDNIESTLTTMSSGSVSVLKLRKVTKRNNFDESDRTWTYESSFEFIAVEN